MKSLSLLQIRQARRNGWQRWFLDPAVAVCAVVFWLLFKVLPLKQASAVGAALGQAAGHLSPRRTRIARRNLEIAFPDKTFAERERILTRTWRHWGRFYAEMPHAAELIRTASFAGISHLERAHKAGRGGFVGSAHLGNWEFLVSSPCFHGIQINSIYRPANNPWLDKLLFQRRRGSLIPKGSKGARQMIEILRQKGFITVLCDQKLREGLPIPFFGKPAMTASAIASLSLKLDVPILMAFSIRQRDGRYRLTILPPLKKPRGLPPEEAAVKLLTDINALIEKWIRRTPEQWLWMHRRFDKSEY